MDAAMTMVLDQYRRMARQCPDAECAEMQADRYEPHAIQYAAIVAIFREEAARRRAADTDD